MNFAGLEGSRRPSFHQIQAKTGASTYTSAAIVGDQLGIGHLGDSPVIEVPVDDAPARQLNVDHSSLREWVLAGRMTAEQAWDSLLGLRVADLDAKRAGRPDYSYYERLERVASPEEFWRMIDERIASGDGYLFSCGAFIDQKAIDFRRSIRNYLLALGVGC